MFVFPGFILSRPDLDPVKGEEGKGREKETCKCREGDKGVQKLGCD